MVLLVGCCWAAVLLLRYRRRCRRCRRRATVDTWRQALADAQMGAALRAAEVLEFDEAAGGGGEGRGEGG